MNNNLIPTLLFWENGNTWYGNRGDARFFIRPAKKEPPDGAPEAQVQSVLEVELWRGPLTKDLSEIIASVSFPLSEEGLAQTTSWLEAQAEALNR